MNDAPLKVAIVVSGPALPRWQVDALAELQRRCDAAITTVVRLGDAAEPLGAGRLWRRYRRRLALLDAVTDMLPSEPEIVATDQELTAEFADRVRSQAPDIILWLSQTAPPGTLIDVAPHGLWRFRFEPDDPAGVQGFAAVAGGRPSVALALDRVGPRDDEIRPLRQGHVRTARYSYARTLERVTAIAGQWLWQCAREARLTGAVAAGAPVEAKRAIAGPGNVAMLRLFAGMASGFAGELMRKAFTIDQWAIGYARVPVARFLDDPSAVDFTWIVPGGRARFVADPFLRQDAETSIFCEYFDHWVGIGEIAELREADGFAVPARRTLFRDGSHYSYPFVITPAGEGTGFRLMPENHAKQAAIAYADGDPAAGHTVLDGAGILDATILAHDGRYWCFCTTVEHGGDQNLFVYYADDALGPYGAHPLNPVKSDVRSARPAGRPVVLDGRILRPAQNGAETYGASLILNEIVELTPQRYVERPVQEITAAMLDGGRGAVGGRHRDGCHHLDHTGDAIVIDAKRVVFHPMAWWFLLRDRQT